MARRRDQGLSRRRFLKGTALGVAGLGVMALTPVWSSDGTANGPSEPEAAARPNKGGAQHSGPIVAYVRDAAKGEVVLMVGTREVVRRDPALASRLVECCEV